MNKYYLHKFSNGSFRAYKILNWDTDVCYFLKVYYFKNSDFGIHTECSSNKEPFEGLIEIDKNIFEYYLNGVMKRINNA